MSISKADSYRLSIFLFHRVYPVRDIFWDPMDPVRFEKVVSYMAKKFSFVNLEQFFLDSKRYDTSKPIASLVFDDGYKDFIEYAMPVLHKYRCPASMYVVTSCADTGIPPWTYVMDFLFLHTKCMSVKLNLDYLPEHLKHARWKSREERISYAKQLKPFLKSLSNNHRLELCQQIRTSFDDIVLPQELMMNWDDIRQIRKEGIAVGSHTVSHPMLGSMADKEIYLELAQSREVIKRELGAFPATISYPIGSYDQRVISISKDVGYQLGLAVKQRPYYSSKDSLYEIPRIEIHNEDLLKTRLRMFGVIQGIKRIMRRDS